MWKVSGRSSALNRAEALLSAKRSSAGDGGSTQDSPTKTQGASFRTGPVPPNSHNLFSDLSDLASETSASEQGAASATLANTQENLERKGDSTQDLRPQSSLGEGSRFLKKAPKPANSSHSPVSRNRAQAVVQPRCVSSSQHGSQAPALRRLAEIESRVRSRKQELEQAKKASAAVLSQASDVEMSPAAAVQTQLQKKYKGVLHCIVQSYRAEGAEVFFRGASVNAIRGFPMSSTMFLMYELSLQFFRSH